jgi:uncharacterized protein (DUF1810 family)
MDNARAHQAQQLLDNPIFLEALEQVNQGINREMDTIKPDDIKSMQSLIMMRQAANKIFQHIHLIAQDNDAKVKVFNARPRNRFGF